MATRFKCPCGKILSAPDGSEGKTAKCPGCGRLLLVPAKTLTAEKEEGSPEAVSTVPGRESPSGPAETSGKGSKGRIVLAESNAHDCEQARVMLEDHGYEVLVAEDGEKAVDLIRSAKPGLVLVDLKTEKLSGFQVVKAIADSFDARNKDVWKTPFVMTAPKVTGRDRQYAISLGVMHYFAKPLAPGSLCARIEQVLGHVPPGIARK